MVNYECNPGYQRTGLPVLLCQSNGTWSSGVPTCTRQQCYEFPEIENGFVVEKDRTYFYGDEARVECHKGKIFHKSFKVKLFTVMHRKKGGN